MTGPRTQRKPTFLWQGVLIMLPVSVLALVSLASLLRDEQAAEQDARRRAAENVQSLARAVRSLVNDELHQFLVLQNEWTMELRLESQPGVTSDANRKRTLDIAQWEQNNPGLNLADLAVYECSLLADGRQIDPREIPIVPVPPKWFQELSPRQKELWEALREGNATNAAPQSDVRAFLNSGVSAEAAQAAANLEQQLGNRSFSTDLSDSGLSESGISFRGIAFYQLLNDPGTRLSNILEQSFWSEVIDSPSFIAPVLLEMAERKTNGASAVACEKVRHMRQLWNIQAKARRLMASLRNLPELKNWNPPRFSACWAEGESSRALALFTPSTFVSQANDAEGAPLSGRGYNIWFVSEPVIEAIFAKALEANRFLIPDYVTVIVTVQQSPLHRFHNSTAVRNESLLGRATQKFGAYSQPDSASFDVSFHLASREQMLSAEHRRGLLFGFLILGTVAAALSGLFAARRAFDQQLQLNEQKSNFVSSVSHELRAPIASVRLLAESLERGKIAEPGKQKEYFGFIVQECRRLSSLIENVLDFSRIEQGRKQYEFEPTNLAALVNQTVALMQPYAAEKGVSLIWETSNIEHRTSNIQCQTTASLTPGIPHLACSERTSNIELNVDGKAIQQALVNLIDNAIKHSPRGEAVTVGMRVQSSEVISDQSSVISPSAERTIEATRNPQPEASIHHPPSTINLSVSDHGPGIPAAEHGKIFERFYRRGSELRRETQGVGIGLSIVKHIVEAHGGRVLVESAVGQGSRFTIELPLKNSTTDEHG